MLELYCSANIFLSPCLVQAIRPLQPQSTFGVYRNWDIYKPHSEILYPLWSVAHFPRFMISGDFSGFSRLLYPRPIYWRVLWQAETWVENNIKKTFSQSGGCPSEPFKALKFRLPSVCFSLPLRANSPKFSVVYLIQHSRSPPKFLILPLIQQGHPEPPTSRESQLLCFAPSSRAISAQPSSTPHSTYDNDNTLCLDFTAELAPSSVVRVLLSWTRRDASATSSPRVPHLLVRSPSTNLLLIFHSPHTVIQSLVGCLFRLLAHRQLRCHQPLWPSLCTFDASYFYFATYHAPCVASKQQAWFS